MTHVKRKHFNFKDRLGFFWSRVNKQNADECWLWTGFVDKGGYGKFKVGDYRVEKIKSILAHRFSWELANGPIPRGKSSHDYCILHRCDTPACVNPKHLFLGSQEDNIRDMIKKGRYVCWARKYYDSRRRG